MRRRQLNTWVQVNLRIQEAQRRKLDAAAKANQVSFNDEVRRRLAESFQREPLESLLYKIGMVQVAQSGKRAPTILGGGEAQVPQQEQEKGGKS
jgi:hypothetical protein